MMQGCFKQHEEGPLKVASLFALQRCIKAVMQQMSLIQISCFKGKGSRNFLWLYMQPCAATTDRQIYMYPRCVHLEVVQALTLE